MLPIFELEKALKTDYSGSPIAKFRVPMTRFENVKGAWDTWKGKSANKNR